MTVRFAAIGLDHDHIYGMTDQMLAAGGQLASFHAAEATQAQRYAQRYPQAARVTDMRAILEDRSIDLVLTAAVNADRARIGVSAMQHGKDVLADKPGILTEEDLDGVRNAHAGTGRRFIVHFSERLTQPAAAKAEELIAAGAIGRVINTVGLGPHRLRAPTRPDWFFQRARSGGILVDIAAHQYDQFLAFTGSRGAVVRHAVAANRAHPQFTEFQDFGEVALEGDGQGVPATGYIRVDWFTPEGLGVWGDGRNIILGTEGTIELRKYVDMAGRPGGHHLFLVDAQTTRYIDCRDVVHPFGARFLADVRDRTETAMTQAHCLLACELALRAQQMADGQ
jgi:predicted dehydrogenase